MDLVAIGVAIVREFLRMSLEAVGGRVGKIAPARSSVYDVAMRLFTISLLVLLPLCAQDKQDKQDKSKGGGQATNIKVLKTQNRQEIVPIMRTFNAGLGVECNFCHVQGNFPSDDNPKKDIARAMITMAEHINSNFPDGKVHVTCFTCHRGETQPKTAPEAKPAAQ